MTSTLIKNARVLDATGDNPYRADVLIENNRIARVQRLGGGGAAAGGAYGARYAGGTTSIGGGAQTVVDANGATLMPGLVEAHAHPSFLNFERVEQVGEIPPEEHAFGTLKNAELMLMNGFTSLFCAASARKRADVVVRNAINAGQFAGPRIRAASPELTPTAGLGDVSMDHLERLSFAIVCDGADEFRKVSRAMVREGVDVLKMNPSGDEFVPHNRAQVTCMTEAEIAAVCEVGLTHGVHVAVHARSSQSVKWSLKHGADIIYHANFADDEALAMLEAQRERIFVAPAIGIQITTLNEASGWGVTREMAVEMGVQDSLEGAVRNMQHLLRAGVRVLPGGDYGFAWNPIGTNARDLEHFVRYLGMSPKADSPGADHLPRLRRWLVPREAANRGRGRGTYLGVQVDGDPGQDRTRDRRCPRSHGRRSWPRPTEMTLNERNHHPFRSAA
ncbi:MAG: amidohydrolase family protein [Burkholderiaceae bacterium]